jgi:hypothetical protein
VETEMTVEQSQSVKKMEKRISKEKWKMGEAVGK